MRTTDSEGKLGERPAVVLLGASNLTRCISTVVDGARALFDQSLDFYVALGHGRSYGMRTKILHRELPGIRQCGLWPALERTSQPVYGLFADIGNDIIYGAPLPMIEGWLRFALEQLSARSARLVMVQVPVARLRRITKREIWFMQNVLARNIVLDAPRMLDQAEQLAAVIARLAAEYGATLVEQQASWYGFDPIHYPLRKWHNVWSQILAPLAPSPPPPSAVPAWSPRSSLTQWSYLRARVPEHRWFFGREQCAEQPCGAFSDGSRFYLY